MTALRPHRRFAIQLFGRLAVLLAAAAATAALIGFGQAPAAALIAFAATLAATVSLWRVVTQSNADLARFVVALERSDLAQSFRRDGRGAGFDRVGAAYEGALARLRAERATSAGARREAEALIDGTPTPLLVLGPGDAVRFANKTARRLFGLDDPARLDALLPFGPPFVAALRAAAPGPTRLAHLVLDGLSQRVALDTTLATIGGEARRIVSVKPIQVELDQAELAAQVDLVRVLTHEVMNSLTPVTSLAGTAAGLVAALDPSLAPGIADARLATEALARRAAELERFVTNYKGFSDAPALHRAPIDVAGWFADLAGWFAASPAGAGVAFTWQVAEGIEPADGDRALLTQVMLNLLKNAGEAAAAVPRPTVTLDAAPAHDGRVRLTVADNGPGVPPALARDVFLPFFTTKPAGTGIGLSFARQIVMLHGGQIGVAAHGRGCIELVLPTRSAAHVSTDPQQTDIRL